MELKTKKTPVGKWSQINPKMEIKVMNHFWNETENGDSTIARKFNLPKQQVTALIAAKLDLHFDRINQRIEKKDYGGI